MVIIRKPHKKEFPSIINLIRELAKFEKLLPPNEDAKKRLYEDSFGRTRKFEILVAEVNNIPLTPFNGGKSKLVGYAFYFFTYSSFLAKPTLYLEDIFISRRWRNKGIGKKFFEELLRIARRNKCGRIEWAVLDWNKNAIRFYEKMGAKELKEWRYYRLQIEDYRLKI
jgi:GNAT superfamily N-acetyltransferase